jgi:metal-responsive CopG/Arc/MetJ family transcriptional regulator
MTETKVEIKTDTLNITLPLELIREMDEDRKRTLKSRSEYIKDLIYADLRQEKLL